jgi:hypothetical protein
MLAEGRQVQFDPAFTYPVRVTRSDGLTVRRKAMFVVNSTGTGYDDYVFETLATQRGIFIGVASRRHDPGMQRAQQAIVCTQFPANSACANLRAYYTDWAEAALGVHLTTFSAT